MNNIRKISRVFYMQFRQELLSTRTIVLFLVMGIFIASSLEPVAVMAQKIGIKTTPMGFVHIMNDHVSQIILTIGLIFLYSTAPFRKGTFFYVVYRSGQRIWELGNILYIFFLSFFYTVFIAAVSLLVFVGNIDFNMDSWGKIWGTLARTNAAAQFQVKLDVSDFLVGKYEPVPALVYSFLLVCGVFFLLGLLMYVCNLHIGKGSGIFVAGFLVFLDTMIYNSWTPDVYRFSPLTLAKLTTYTNYHQHYGLDLKYAGIFIGAGIMVLSITIVLLTGKKEKNYE